MRSNTIPKIQKWVFYRTLSISNLELPKVIITSGVDPLNGFNNWINSQGFKQGIKANLEGEPYKRIVISKPIHDGFFWCIAAEYGITTLPVPDWFLGRHENKLSA